MVEKYAKKTGLAYLKGSKQVLAPHLNNLYMDVANLMAQEILTDPKYRYIAESITMNPAERRLLQMSVMETLKKGKFFDNASPQEATIKLNHLQENKAVMESMVKNFTQKREAMQKQVIRIQPKQQKKAIAGPKMA